MAAGGVLLALVLAGLAVVGSRVLGMGLLLLAGAAWISVLTGLLGAAQSVAATWVRGRALSAWLLIYQGGLALGSLLWGLLAESSLVRALLLPAGCLVLSAVMTRRLTVDVDELPAPEPSGSWGEPLTVEDVRDDGGPVLAPVEYDVGGGDVDGFVTAMFDVRAIRRRDGARNWHLYRDVALPGRVVECFPVASWG